MERLPPRYSPDNSPEARARRMASNIHVLARVVETDTYRYILGANGQIVDVHQKHPDPQPTSLPAAPQGEVVDLNANVVELRGPDAAA